jgi:TRAP-type C4-dicarboxylate transport system permease small subunit
VKVLKWLDENLEKVLGMIAISAIVIVLTIQVVSRYVFKYSLSFAEEAATMLFVMFTYLGASLAVKRRQHLRITLLVNMLSVKGQKIEGIVVNVLFFIAISVVTYGMTTVIGSLKKYKMATPIMQIPKYLIYAVVFACLCVMLLRLIQDTVLLVLEITGKRKEVPA